MKALITWFVDNPVATNLLMWLLIAGGLLTLPTIYREEFPNIDIDAIAIRVPYPGAAPEEVEQSVCLRVEEAIEGTPGIKKINTVAADSLCSVNVELLRGVDKGRALNDIKGKVDAIDTFPDDAELPVTAEVVMVANVMQVVLFGPADERTLKALGEDMRRRLLDLDGVSQVSLKFVRPYEFSIDVGEDALRRYGITLQQVADALRLNSIDLPGGDINTADGEILLRTLTQAGTVREFERIVILTHPDGTNVTLADIGTVRDTFEDTDLLALFDGQPAIVVDVRRVGDEDVLEVSDKVKAFMADYRQRLPDGIGLTVWEDESQDLVDRLEMMGQNAWSGLLLVLVVLAAFLHLRLALWVAVGIPVALLGMVMMFPIAGISISTLSVMGVVLVLGILVDDAIVVAERTYAHQRMGKPLRQAAIDGTHEVAVPVIFGVLTTLAAFMPLVLGNSGMSPFFRGVGITAIIALSFSLLESQLILPMHLAHGRELGDTRNMSAVAIWWERGQQRFADWLDHLVTTRYIPGLEWSLRWRYLSAAIALVALLVVGAMLASGRILVQFFPAVEGSHLYALVEMPEGTPVETTRQAVDRLQQSAAALRQEIDGDLARGGEQGLFTHTMVSIGTRMPRGAIERQHTGGSHFAEVTMKLDVPADYDGTPPSGIANRWRELTGPIPDAVALSFNATAFDAGEDINIQFRGDDLEQLKQAANRLGEELARYPGVFDVAESFRAGQQELQLSLLPEARNLGLTGTDLARQVRRAFYGEEVQRVQIGREDVKVMVRFPADQRRSLGDIEEMRIRTADGAEVPFGSVAQMRLGDSYSAISRVDGKRVISVVARVDRSIASPEEVRAALQAAVLPDILRQFPELAYEQSGEAEQSAEAGAELFRNTLLALLVIYALLAIPLRSYLQPLIMMSVIPFGAIGAVVGHYLLGMELVFFSLLGIVALAGVAINASLVMVDYINRRREQGADMLAAVIEAGTTRFRPIILTSLTTFVGLVPMIFNDVISTSIFIPMAVSLGFGVVLSALVTLFLVPCFYVMLEDARLRVRRRRAQLRQTIRRSWQQGGWPG